MTTCPRCKLIFKHPGHIRAGSSKSHKKAIASRINGAKGGRPRKTPTPASETITRPTAPAAPTYTSQAGALTSRQASGRATSALPDAVGHARGTALPQPVEGRPNQQEAAR